MVMLTIIGAMLVTLSLVGILIINKVGIIDALLAAILVGLLFLSIGYSCLNADAYKQGQIDYHNGIIKYELKAQKDSSVVWEEIKGNK